LKDRNKLGATEKIDSSGSLAQERRPVPDMFYGSVLKLLASIMSVLWASRTLRLLQEGKLKTVKT
jgi:hypothetical protein